jgi:7,8-dihydroneopterin aldolase/epimerase/oxygenase
MDRLSLSGMKVRVRVGCTARERASAQILELDVDLFLPLTRAGLHDDLAASVDYSSLTAFLRAEIEGRAWRLIEAVAEKAASMILEKFHVPRVAVRVRKRALPGIAFAEVAVERRAKNVVR